MLRMPVQTVGTVLLSLHEKDIKEIRHYEENMEEKQDGKTY